MTSEIDELIKTAEVTTGAVLLKKVFWKISQKFTGKHLCQSLFF